MDKIREALEGLVKYEGIHKYEYLDRGIGSATESGKRWLAAREALSAPVASDARELVKMIEEDCFDPWRCDKEANKYRGAFDTEDAIALVERFVAERERKAREEIERRYEELHKWLMGEAGDFPVSQPGWRYGWRIELKARLAAIKEAGNGNA